MIRAESVLKTLAQISIFFVAFLAVHNIYYFTIIHQNQTEGDSIDYHIPIADRLANFDFIYTDAIRPQLYYPASNEIILAAFKTLNLPLNIYNILAWFLLGVSCFYLARAFKLNNYYSLLFATTILTLNTVTRWLGAQTIDIWLAFFFVASLVLLKSKRNTLLTALSLGITLGMLIGSKYTAIPFTMILISFFAKEFIEKIKNFKNFIVFLIPFLILGVSWYVRNFFLFDNPFYPLSFLIFRGTNLFTDNVANITLSYPLEMINAFIAEFRIWAFAPFVAIFILVETWKARYKECSEIYKLTLLGLILFTLYPFFPTSEEPWIMVSSLRYSYPFFIILILAIFLYAERVKKTETLALIAVANMVLLHPLAYYPKLAFLYIPLGIAAVYFLDKKFKKDK